MKWQEVRDKYPDAWVLIEAIQAHNDKDRRIVDNISVLDKFENALDAVRQYKILHSDYPERDILVVNTENPKLDIKIQHWVGIRGNS
jgi:hypothetical protein